MQQNPYNIPPPNQLTGAIPAKLGNLNSLAYLDISSNQLTGTIPPELGNLSNLVHLDLFKNPLFRRDASAEPDRPVDARLLLVRRDEPLRAY